MNKKIFIILGVILIALIALIAINTKSKTADTTSKKLQVVASFYPMYYFAAQIGGNKADVSSITPASAEPHDYEPTTEDIIRMQTANLLVLNGGALESWGSKVKNDLQGKNIKVVTAGDNLVTKRMQENGKDIKDPHVWLNPLLAKTEVINIEKGFEAIDPTNKTYFQNNAKQLFVKLDQLNNEYKKGLQSCQKKDFVTSHAAFAYLAQQYGLNQIAIAGVSPDEEPSSQKLAEITDLVKQKNIKIIFFESLVSPKLAQTIANETGTKTMVLDPIEGITNADQKSGHTYLTVMQNNLKSLQTALECLN